MADKMTVRKHYLNLRINLSPGEYEQLSVALCTRFFSSIDLSTVKTIHCYLPIVHRKEPNTWHIIDRLNKDFPNIQISLPRMENEQTIVNFYYSGKNQISENKWGIPEPQFGDVTPVSEIDLVIVPLLVFDKKGNRVGYGKGFYDRFLKNCRPDCKKIGFSFFDPLDEISDADTHDVRLDQVITPSRVFRFY